MVVCRPCCPLGAAPARAVKHIRKRARSRAGGVPSALKVTGAVARAGHGRALGSTRTGDPLVFAPVRFGHAHHAQHSMQYCRYSPASTAGRAFRSRAASQVVAQRRHAAAVEKTNLFIEVAKGTERAVDSWERYASWVNMKTGPTGKERYISYGMYDLYDIDDLLKQTMAAASVEPKSEPLDAGMVQYIVAYQALAPVLTAAAGYYDREVYTTDKLAKGKAYHQQMVPLATAFLAERER